MVIKNGRFGKFLACPGFPQCKNAKPLPEDEVKEPCPKCGSKLVKRKSKKGKTFYDNSPEYIEKALNDSLKRLSTDYIDLYQIHYRDETTPLDAVVEVLERFKEQEKRPYLILLNHQTAYDQFFVAYSFRGDVGKNMWQTSHSKNTSLALSHNFSFY